MVEGDPVGMAQAFDNLIANALEHGGPPLVVTGAEVAGRLRVTVANGGPGNRRAGDPAVGDPAMAGGPVRTGDPAAARGPAAKGGVLARLRPPRRDPRRGHGVALVSRVAAAHRGRFALCRTGSGCVAALELPLCDASVARAA